MIRVVCPSFQDCRIALRLFRRTPLATGIALASIALSVGAASVVFAAIKSDGYPFAKGPLVPGFGHE
jgi:hypothetical protein